MKNLRQLGRILLSNLVMNTPGLNAYLQKSNEKKFDEIADKGFSKHGTFEDDVKDILKNFYTNNTLYSQLIFTKNPKDVPFVGKMPSYINAIQKYVDSPNGANLRDFWFLRYLTEEAFRRMCLGIGVEPCPIVYGYDFPYSYLLDFKNGNAILNSRINYFDCRSTFLIETLNSMTADYKNFENIFKIIENPQSLNDKDFFVAVTNAMDLYLFSAIRVGGAKKEDIDAFTTWEYHFPNSLDRDLMGFYATRKQLQSGKLYGGEIRGGLRQKEEEYFDYLVKGGLEQSLVACENLLGTFVSSPLDKSSNGMLGKIAIEIFDKMANSFYSLVGAEIDEEESFEEYVNWVESVFDEEGYDRENIKNNPPISIFENMLPPEGDVYSLDGEKIEPTEDFDEQNGQN